MTGPTIGTIGIFLTLTGLLGTFFYVQLANWLRDLIALETKWNLNETGNTPEVKQAQRECRYALPGLNNGIPKLMATGVTVFIIIVSVLALIIVWPLLFVTILAMCLVLAFLAFLLIYAILLRYLLARGYRIARSVDARIEAKFKPTHVEEPPAHGPIA